ncbi:MAG: PIN domain-containing protein [Rhodoferax sp.]|uniref:PIN domain-containing protein n=1 Tax=Rhodoferax sp. TaxID=50421 RepID=UPI003266205B
MKELHVLLDFENVQPSLEVLAKLAPGFTDVWLFHGPHQAKQAQALAASHARVTLVPRSGQGPNALDFHVAFYLGYVAAKHPDAELVVIANDRGYDPMLTHARMLKFRARRVGYKAPVAKQIAMVKPVAPLAVPVASKKAAAKKTVAPKVVAKQASPKPAAHAKTVPAKKAPAANKASAAKKVAAKKAVAPKSAKAVQPIKAAKPAKARPAPQAKPSATPEAKLLARITKGLAKMGDKAPTKFKSFLNALKPMLDKNSTAADIEAMAQTLQTKGVMQVQGGMVT